VCAAASAAAAAAAAAAVSTFLLREAAAVGEFSLELQKRFARRVVVGGVHRLPAALLFGGRLLGTKHAARH
jgi:hypothetical protein